jgi:predicted PurR-regulated permease PerM
MFGVVGIIVGPIIAALFVTVWELFGSAMEKMNQAPDQRETETG